MRLRVMLVLISVITVITRIVFCISPLIMTEITAEHSTAEQNPIPPDKTVVQWVTVIVDTCRVITTFV